MGQSAATGQKLEERYFVQKVKLGEGSFGKVWRARDRKTQQDVAIKQLDKALLPKRGVKRQDIEREIAMMKAEVHENLTRLYDTFEDEQNIYLALEYCDGGDFGDKVKERGMEIQEPEVAEWMRQVCAAINALHQKNICHRDIKPDNFMVATAANGQHLLKLADFGLAVYVPTGQRLYDKCGTPAFMAPEQHRVSKNSGGYGFPSDVWAAGVSMYMVMFGGRHPFITPQNQLDDRAMSEGRLDFRQSPAGQNFFGFDLGMGELRFSNEARSLCQGLVQVDERQRLTAANALSSVWINHGRAVMPVSGAVNGSVSVAARLPSKGPAPQDTSQPYMPNRNPQAGYGMEVPVPLPGSQQPGQSGWYSQGTSAGDHVARPGTVARLNAENSELKAQLEAANLAKLQAEEREAAARLAKQQQRPALGRQATRNMGSASVPASTGASGFGVLIEGQKCRYQSDKYGWMNTTVSKLNLSEGTYDLEVKKHAPLDRIAPCSPVNASEAWPPGTTVKYHSASANQWVLAVVQSANESDNTYNLDVKEHADVDRIRARLSGVSDDTLPPAGDGGAAGVISKGFAGFADAISMVRSSSEKRNGNPYGSQRPSDFAGGATAMPGPEDSRDPRSHLDGGRGGPASPESQGVYGVHEGMWCAFEVPQSAGEYREAVVEAVSRQDGNYLVSVQLDNGTRRSLAGDRLRAPWDESRVWPPGMKVYYYSSSSTSWINATVVSFHPDHRRYQLDVKDGVTHERIRPRWEPGYG
eukprot:TRINITY_DN1287_c0_g2_i1.p1 TRINITY_DN1287_c0_g2~~TRINITY_DN1287_c0_g2_i1.p1  ORF type:complete len:755 (+),score=172.99 TRINITY_DN1287_c0_g2_i1:116-2380(+)